MRLLQKAKEFLDDIIRERKSKIEYTPSKLY